MLIPFDKLFEKYKINCTGLLHCGASFVQEREMYDKLKIPEVIWVEAIPDVYEEAVKLLSGYPDQSIVNACVSDTDGDSVIFHVSNNEAQSSSMLELKHHAVIHPEVRYVRDIEIETHRLDTLLKYWDVSHINFGNFDLQGAELLALKGLGRLISQFDYFYLEVNSKEVYKDCALVEEVDEFLKDFSRVETGMWVGNSWTDALYIRKTKLNELAGSN